MTHASLPLAGKTVLIQGAGRAPGPALARALAAQGAAVAACDLSPVLLDPLEAAAQGLPGQVRGYVGDTARGMPARAILDEVDDDFGPVDILIHNPRIAPGTPLLQTDEWDWHHTIDANLNGSFLLTHLIARSMVERQAGGVIVYVIEALPAGGEAGRAAYAASQMGLLALARAAAQEFIAYNIRVYGVCVQEVEADRRSWHGEAAPQDAAFERPLSTAELVLFLCGPDAARIPGQVFRGQAR